MTCRRLGRAARRPATPAAFAQHTSSAVEGPGWPERRCRSAEKGREMPLNRLGRASTEDPGSHQLTDLPWAESTAVALDRYRDQLPSADERARVAEYRMTPREFLENPHLRVEALENELAHSF